MAREKFRVRGTSYNFMVVIGMGKRKVQLFFRGVIFGAWFSRYYGMYDGATGATGPNGMGAIAHISVDFKFPR